MSHVSTLNTCRVYEKTRSLQLLETMTRPIYNFDESNLVFTNYFITTPRDGRYFRMNRGGENEIKYLFTDPS